MSGRSAENRVVQEVAAISLGRGDDDSRVRVRLSESELTVDFPVVLFPEEKLRRYGQPLRYLVMERPNGVRFQAFESRDEEPDHAFLAELESLLPETE